MVSQKTLILGIFLVLLLNVSQAMALGEKQCVSGNLYINIISPNDYAIGENINNITVRLKAGTFDFTKTKITAILYEGTNEVGTKLTNGFVNSLGEVKIDFKYSSSRSSNLEVKLIVDNGNGQTFQATKPIKVLPTLDNKLTCDVQGYINRQISCSWKTYDKDTNSVVSANPIVSVKQGSSDLVYSPVGSNGLTFQSEITGSATVTVSVSKNNYIGDTDSLNVNIQNIETFTSFKVDNKDYLTYYQFETGVHSFELSALDSGIPSEVSKVEATITTPSNQKLPITFNKISTGVFRTSFNLDEAGRTYSLDGSLIYPGTKDSIPFSYKLTTTGTTTEDLSGQTNVILVSAIVGIIMLFAFIILAIWLKGKK